ncbi:MAG: 3-isopropylmalate/(R)-2-methylmalate dehydratase small subunit [Tepidanaerobacteraceae bacterium]|nr:3-isopropylmalate/(R)-2-methylmalate dehydratase small subunit [Tepidanaerobacteraceae bacterium]
MKFTGRAWVFGDNVDTDVIIPARYLNTVQPEELALHCMEDIDPEFAKKVKRGDIIVAGRNFGCGSSREHAPLAIKAAGVSCVIAKSFARIFYRNAINIGLSVLECEEAAENIKENDEVEIDLEKGIIKNLTSGREFAAKPYPDFIEEIIRAGGLLNYARRGGEGRV